jgi:hypothetical protein
MAGDVAIGIRVSTADMTYQKKIDQALATKYGAPTKKLAPIACSNEFGVSWHAQPREWILSGLHVRYDPVSTDCSKDGLLTVELEASYRRVKALQHRQEKSEPGL